MAARVDQGQFSPFTFSAGNPVFRFVTTDASSFGFILKTGGGLPEKLMLELGPSSRLGWAGGQREQGSIEAQIWLSPEHLLLIHHQER